jgi:DNA-binding transcriptional MerR regulator
MDHRHSIGTLARRTGVKVPTIRFYESVGLLPAPPRTKSNRRVYGDGAVNRLRFIRHARELGFELSTIRQLLELTGEPQRSCEKVDAIAREHLREIESRIERLTALRSEVRRMLKQCMHGRIADCRIVEVLGHHEFCHHTEH